MAAKQIPIPALEVEKLASYGLPNKDIAQFYGCSTDTLERRFRSQLDRGRNNLRTRLRVKQIQVAMKGNPAMLIFLGKQYLGQTDKIQQGGKIDMNYTANKKTLDAKEFEKAFSHVMASSRRSDAVEGAKSKE